MNATDQLGSPLMTAVFKTLIGFTLAAAAITHLTVGASPFLWGVIGGGVIQVANLAALIWLGTRLAQARPRGAAFYALLFVFKIAALVGLTIYTLKMLPVDVIGFMVGVGLLIPAGLLASATQPLVAPSTTAEVKA